MNREQYELLRQLRRRLEDRAFVAEDPESYREGVRETLDQVEAALSAPRTVPIRDDRDDELVTTHYLAVT